MPAVNPLLTPSELPYQLPPFDRIRPDHYRAAFAQGMEEQRAEVDEITSGNHPPTFDNTIVALEHSGRLLERVASVFFNEASSNTSEAVQQIQAETAPELAAHEDAIHLDSALFERIDELHRRRDELDLDGESSWLLERYHTDFVRAGAALPEADRERLRAINTQLSTLSTSFQQRLLAGQNAATVLIDDAADLAGLTDDEIAAAAATAQAHGHEGRYAIGLILPTDQPGLASLGNRGLRERLLRASTSRGARGGEHDTRDLVKRIATLRAERAQLLGYPDHASYVIADQTAKTPQAVRDLLGDLAASAAANARAEAADLSALAAADGLSELAAWDWQYYAERLREARYDFSSAEMRPYFELERVLEDGVFYAAQQVYGITLTRRQDLAGYHDDVRVYEVFDADGTGLGLFLADFHARESKRGGAWMNSFVEQSHLLGSRPVVGNNYNFTKPATGQPALLSFDEVGTLFHEFGHALHGLLSDVQYPRFAGTSVPRDFVEFPSQVNEMWALWPQVLENYARHHDTGEPMPAELVEKLRATQQFNQGFDTVAYLGAALLDLAWHQLGPDEIPDDVEAFEADVLASVGLDLPAVPPRYRSSYFAHIFFGGYSAGYYSYIWSEVLDADTVAWFTEHGGMTRANGDHFRAELLSRGGSGDVMEAFRRFRGRDADIAPLLERRGLTTAGTGT